MTDNGTGAGIGCIIKSPGTLTIITRIGGYNLCIEVDQPVLLAAVRIVTGIARCKIVKSVQIFITLPEVCRSTKIGITSIGSVLVAFEAQFA